MPISGSLKYEVLKRAKTRCDLSEAFDSPGSVFFPLKIREMMYKDASRNG